MMLKVFNKIELDSELNKAEDKDIPFPMFEDETDDEEYDCLPDYISDFEEQEEVVDSLSQKKTYSIGRILHSNLNELYDNYSGDLPSDHENELQANSRFTDDTSSPPHTTRDGRDQTSNSKSKPQQNSHYHTASVPPDNSDDSEVEIGMPCPKMNSQIPEI